MMACQVDHLPSCCWLTAKIVYFSHPFWLFQRWQGLSSPFWWLWIICLALHPIVEWLCLRLCEPWFTGWVALHLHHVCAWRLAACIARSCKPLRSRRASPFPDWPSWPDTTVNLVQKLSCYAWDHMLVVHSLPRPLTGPPKNQIVSPPRVKTTLSFLVTLWIERLQELMVGLIFICAHANSSSGFLRSLTVQAGIWRRVVTLSKSIQLGVFDLKIWLLLPCVFHLLGWSQILIIKVIV